MISVVLRFCNLSWCACSGSWSVTLRPAPLKTSGLQRFHLRAWQKWVFLPLSSSAPSCIIYLGQFLPSPLVPLNLSTCQAIPEERKTSLEEELDNLMDISIGEKNYGKVPKCKNYNYLFICLRKLCKSNSPEIASNKRMKQDFIHPFKLTFRDKEMGRKYSQQNDYMWVILEIQPTKWLHLGKSGNTANRLTTCG